MGLRLGSVLPLPLLLLLLVPPGSAVEAPLARLGCWFVEEAPGAAGSVMPGKLNQRRALLLLPSPARRTASRDEPTALPLDVEPGLAFRVFDPSGALWGGGDPSAAPFWLGADAGEAESPVSCEINAYQLHDAHVPWAAGLSTRDGCPRALERGQWLIVGLRNPDAGYGVSSIVHREETPSQDGGGGGSSVATATAVLSVFSRTPFLEAQLGQDVVIHCGFSAPATAFSVEWRQQHHGAGRVILAYDGAAGKISVAEEGTELFLEPGSNNVSLRLRRVGVHHEGTYICTIYLSHLHTQQAMELKVVASPRVALHPTPLSVAPGAHADLVCEISGYYPLGASVKWMQRGPGGTPQVDFLDVRESGHRQLPDGTYGFSSVARLVAVRPEDHGTTYVCRVAHMSLGDAGLKKAMTLHVAGSLGPSLEDAVGCFLVAFVLFGLLQAVSRHTFGGQTKTQKVE